MNRKKILEHFIFFAIILVIVQTFMEDLAKYLFWSVKARNMLTISGFIFDIIFSIEFSLRVFYSRKKRGVKNYLFYNRGWVDFLSSIPLLIFSSGPAVMILFSGDGHIATSGIGVLTALKILKTIRVTRILRLVRIIKIFGKIQNTESKMAQHHTSTIATTAVFTIILTQVLFTTFFQTSFDKEMSMRKDYYKNIVESIGECTFKSKSLKKNMTKIFSRDEKIIQLIINKKTIYTRDNDLFNRHYDYDDYKIFTYGKIKLYISGADIHSHMALGNLKVFILILFVVSAFMIIYARHFAQNISDIVHVMNSGFRKKDYLLQVKINKNYKDDEIYKFANYYNNLYLPAKMKRASSRENNQSKNSLSMDDFTSFTNKTE